MNKPFEDMLLAIARDRLGIATLETRRADSLDFHEVAVWQVKDALATAFQAGLQSMLGSEPVAVVTVHGGRVIEANADFPVTIVVDDWDCPLDLGISFSPEPLTAEQRQRLKDRPAEPSISQKE